MIEIFFSLIICLLVCIYVHTVSTGKFELSSIIGVLDLKGYIVFQKITSKFTYPIARQYSISADEFLRTFYIGDESPYKLNIQVAMSILWGTHGVWIPNLSDEYKTYYDFLKDRNTIDYVIYENRNRLWTKPLFDCLICMSPWYGMVVYLILSSLLFREIHLALLPIIALAQGGVNTIYSIIEDRTKKKVE